ncbi:hypothetical protein Ocin01_06298 [Orchesella cincta]|uniref:Uncharacterized protein n=1 Tax=Orchesella cincta TaxID=48709 RepID=A0A1D2N536_ORCCI|nr:hypothetical protein Ocin01_06298 [Orchesella cincta]
MLTGETDFGIDLESIQSRTSKLFLPPILILR